MALSGWLVAGSFGRAQVKAAGGAPAKPEQTVTLSGVGSQIFPENEEEQAARNKLPVRQVDERLQVDFPTGAVALGNWLTIPLHFAPGKLVILNVTQKVANNNIAQWSMLPMHLTLTDGLPTAIKIIPAQLGEVLLDISAKYSDNVLVDQQQKLNVVPSSKGIKQFSLTQGGHDIAMVLEDTEQNSQRSLTPTVSYQDLQYPISLDDASQSKLSVQQDEANPVIRVDSNGMVHALREGTAVITGNFDGAIDTQTVRVYSIDDAPAGFVAFPKGEGEKKPQSE